MKIVMNLMMAGLLCLPASAQNWEVVSTFNDYRQEGWTIYSAPRAGASVTQNSDGTVTITRLEADSETIYLQHDVSWDEPEDIFSVDTWSFTYEFRLKVDEIGGPNGGTDEHLDRASIYPLKNNPETGEPDTFSNGRTWLCSFDENSIGSRYFANPTCPAEIDLTFPCTTFVQAAGLHPAG